MKILLQTQFTLQYFSTKKVHILKVVCTRRRRIQAFFGTVTSREFAGNARK